MLQTPKTYLTTILTKAKVEKNLSKLLQHFIFCCNHNLHFIIDEKELDIKTLLITYCHKLNKTGSFNFRVGYKVTQSKNPKTKFSKSALQSFFSPYIVARLEPKILLSNLENPRKEITDLTKFIPLSNYKTEKTGIVQNKIEEYQKTFNAVSQVDYFNNEKLLIIGTKNLFQKIPTAYPACFVCEDENKEIEIEYNSPLLPKISVLKNINLLDSYLQQEINGEQITFNTCIFIGSLKFENSINTIRNYFNQRKFSKAIFIGEKDIKIDLGNNQIPLRWKWTIPEINFFKDEKNIQHKTIVIYNNELEKKIEEFYQEVRDIEGKHTISLKPIYRFIRRLYFDWGLKNETNLIRLNQIREEFNIALKELLIETLGNIFPDFDFAMYQEPLSRKFSEITQAIKDNCKAEKIKSIPNTIHQLVLPSFLCKLFTNELNQLHSKNVLKVVSLAKSDDSKDEENKMISSIYGSGKIEKFIERLSNAKSEYQLLLYSIEEKALHYYKDKYHEALNKEYISSDRFKICGVEFNDPYYQYSTYDEWLDDFFSFKTDTRETDNYKIIFTDNTKMKLPASKSVLKIANSKKLDTVIEDLSIGDEVQIYANPDKKLLRSIMELTNAELIKIADYYSKLWRLCLLETYRNNIMANESLYDKLKQNRFSVSAYTFNKYLNGEVMFPRSFSDLIIIAKTINHPKLSFDFLKNIVKPKIDEYRGKEIEYGFKFSESINNFILTGERDEFIADLLTDEEVKKIVLLIPVKTIKDIELITTQNNDE